MSRDPEGEQPVEPPPNASRDRDAEPRVLNHDEWLKALGLKALGPRFTDRTDEAVEKGWRSSSSAGPRPRGRRRGSAGDRRSAGREKGQAAFGRTLTTRGREADAETGGHLRDRGRHRCDHHHGRAGAGEHEEARAKPEVVPMGDADGKEGG